ncbi:hypothetical protein NMK34_23960 [Micromonospora sp. BRA006-A]|uniref:hypothetical protein n=1 Tax=Micromonospora sp. BRA006-A TaxID=2962860 RepID=UPI00296E7E5F|nr:hypothetical protein [Micromonospora sp. BRA006-A]MDW3849674.1 hypothetical protein [Micromonospora sp. BRA006-A]
MTSVLALVALLATVCFFAWLDRRPKVDPDQVEKLSLLFTEITALRRDLDRIRRDSKPGQGSRPDSTLTNDNPPSRS